MNEQGMFQDITPCQHQRNILEHFHMLYKHPGGASLNSIQILIMPGCIGCMYLYMPGINEHICAMYAQWGVSLTTV